MTPHEIMIRMTVQPKGGFVTVTSEWELIYRVSFSLWEFSSRENAAQVEFP